MTEKRRNFCTECRKETSYHLENQKYHKVIRDKEYEFKITVAICDECGQEMDIPGLMDFNAKSIDQQYRDIEDIVSVDDIQKLMEIYHIGKAPLSIALGFGEITITRYLAGQMPSKEYSDIIKKALTSPTYMCQLLNENRTKIGETAYQKAIVAVLEIEELFKVSDKMLIAISYIFEKMQEVTPLALQKLLYFTQGIYMVKFNKPLFTEDCMAWVHGPVYEDVYNLFRNFKYSPIEDNRFAIFKGCYKELNDDEKNTIDLVINSFGKYSATVLSEITHNESPWKDARGNQDPLQYSRQIISKDKIKNYFKKVSEKYGVDTEENINRYIQSYM